MERGYIPILQIVKLLAPLALLLVQKKMAVDIFSLCFTNEVWELLVRETNRYASTVVRTTPNSRPWNDTTVPEIKAFIGMLLLFGVLKLPRLELYWSKNYLELDKPGISEIMHRKLDSNSFLGVSILPIMRTIFLLGNQVTTNYSRLGHFLILFCQNSWLITICTKSAV